jgi:hypothetical protein
MHKNIRMTNILRHIDQLVILQEQLFKSSKSDVLLAYQDGATNMARSIRQFVSNDMKVWNELKDEEAIEDARLDQIAEDKEAREF